MRRSTKVFLKSFYKAFVSFFFIFYTLTPSALAISEIPANIQSVSATTEDTSKSILDGISDPEEIAKGEKLEYRTDVLPKAMLNATGQYSISSTSGIWTGVTGGRYITGINTSEVRWGRPENTYKSGLRFDGAGTQSFNADEKFLIGDLTHMNWPVSDAASGATLKVTLNFSNPAVTPSPTFSYYFDINETSNNPWFYYNCSGYPDEQLSTTPCDDVVTFPNAYGDKVFTIGDTKYTLKIDGFQNAYPTGSAVSKFVTEERKDNKAFLLGHLSSVLVERPAISIVKKVNDSDANSTKDAVQVTAGETVNFTYIVQNTGNVKLTDILVTDDKGVAVTCPETELEAGISMTCTGSAKAIAGNYTNIGTVTSSHNLTASDPANYVGVIPTIRICHASNSQTNPYIVHTPSASGDLNGHAGHTGAIWFPGMDTWGDIIPSFTSYDGTYFPGVNWTEYGQSVYENDCLIPQGKIVVNKVLSPTSSSNQAFEIVGSGTPSIEGSPTFLYDSNSNIGSISRNSSHTYNVMPGTYNIAETVPAGWSLVSNTCSNIVITSNETKECTITNTQDGSLTIVKRALPFGTNSFGFTLTGNSVNEQFNLVDNSATEDASKTFSLKAGIYAVAENDYSADWQTTYGCSDGNTIGNIVIEAGKSITCTFTNTKYASISGYKINDADADPETTTDQTYVAGWGIELWNSTNTLKLAETSTDGTGKYSFTKLLPGTYIVKEVLQTGWAVLVVGEQTVTITAGENEVNVNFVNYKQGSIKVIKNVDENGDGDVEDSVDRKGATDWTWTLNGDLGHATGNTVSELRPGSYTVKEINKENYHFTSLVCFGSNNIVIANESATISLKSGEDVVCTFTNSRNLGKLIVIKEVINDNGGSKKATDFSFKIDNGDSQSFIQNSENILKGRNEFTKYAGLTYTITEDQANQDGYSTTYDSCEDIEVPYNGEATCTITNDDIAPTLKVVKKAINDNGGTATITDFGITLTDTILSFGAGSAVGTTTTYEANPTVVANKAYTLSETDLAGYTEGTWSCKDNITQAEVSIPFTLSGGQGITCEITNNDIAPSLTLVKQVVNQYGSNAEASDWNLTADGPTPISGDGGATSGNTFKAGTYTLSESSDLTGYTASGWTCTNSIAVNGSAITLEVGQTTVCTITNSAIQPKLTLVKTVSNKYGGNEQIADFNLYIGTTQVTSGTANLVNANTQYTVSEDNLPGYTASNWGGDCSTDGKITLLPGDNKTCTITNSDVAPTLKIVKKAINDNGGTATITDFGITLTDTTLSFGAGNAVGTTTTYEANPTVSSNKKYTLSETGATGYVQESLVCLDTNNNSLGSEFTLNPGQNVICTIINNDIAPKLTLNKEVSNTHGGNKLESAWTLYAKQGENLAFSGKGATGVNDVVSPNSLQAGSYTLSEEGPVGYEASRWSCTGTGSLNGNVITLLVGQEATCTITNSDKEAGLTVIKNVINDNGGTAVVGDFQIKLNDNLLTFGTGSVNGTTTTYTSTPSVDSNTPYTLSEIDHSGYIEGTWSCKDNSTELIVSHPVTLSEGQGVTCVITNNDIAPTLKLVKSVTNDNGGTLTSKDWTLTATGAEGFSDLGNSTTYHTVKAGVGYVLSESTVSGYASEGWSCNGGTLNGSTVTLGLADNVTCTITNNDIAPTLKLVKSVTNDNGGTLQSKDWTLTATGEAGFNDLGNSTTFHTVKAGVGYVLSESSVSGYASEGWSCNGGTFTNGNIVTLGLVDNVTCTITNNDIAPTLKLVKTVVNNYGGTLESKDWTLTATGEAGFEDTGDSETFHTVKAGIGYVLSESDIFGYESNGWSCNGGTFTNGNTATLGLAENAVCTITNTALPATVVVYKDVVGEGVYSDQEFSVVLEGHESQIITDEAQDPKVAIFENLSAGTYNPEEINMPNGYKALGCNPTPGEDNIVGNGETVKFVCENEIVKPILEIEKENDTLGLDKYAGDPVTYTIFVSTPADSDDTSKYVINNVEVFDLAPAGFDYKSGTWSAISSVRGDIAGSITVEPTYDGSSYATWILGNMVEGETVTLKYGVTISLDQDPGVYPDIAWTKGTSLLSENVLGNVSTGALTPFVGTEVKVIAPDIVEEGEVLGASTIVRLPDTGASTYLTLTALISMIVGFVISMFNSKKQKKNTLKLSFLAVFASLMLMPLTVYAVGYLDVKIEQPKTPTNISKFDIGFVAMSTSADPVKVECFEEGKATPFQTVNAATGNCAVEVSTSGTYKYYVKATVGLNVKDSNVVEVTVNLEKPEAVVDYSKASNTLSFKTANDSITKSIQIFRSEKVSFTANATTLVHTMDVLPNTQYTWTDSSAQAGKTYYYALRAVDSFGNLSPIVSDSEIITVVEKTGTTSQNGQVAGTVSINTSGSTGSDVTATDSTDAEVKGDTDQEAEGEVQSNEDSEKSNAEDSSKKESVFKKYWYLWIGGLLLIGGGIYTYVRKQKKA